MDIECGGITASEQFLAKIARKTFLKLWSYSNLYNKDRKELCDLLVVCGGVAIIFSDKYIKFGSILDVENSWIRWCKKAIFKSVKQVFGAERYIVSNCREIYIDNECNNNFPLEIDVEHLKIYRIVVANGAKEAVESYFKGNSRGSLCVDSRIVGQDDHLHRTANNFKVFTVGDIDPDKGFVHILNEDNLELILGELDTISDFVSYLDAKEKWFRTRGTTVVAAGEEELLAHYFRCILEGNVNFDLPQSGMGNSHYMFTEGLWNELQSDISYLGFKRYLIQSYRWDAIIEMFSVYIESGEAFCYEREFNFVEHESAVRFLAKETRINRAMLIEAMFGALQSASQVEWFSRTALLRNEFVGLVIPYIFVVYPQGALGFEERRQQRFNCLNACCIVFLGLHPEYCFVVGVAFDGMGVDITSSDIIVYKNIDRLDLIKDAIRCQIVFDVYRNNLFTYEMVVKEFPEFTQQEFAQIIEDAHALKLSIEC